MQSQQDVQRWFENLPVLSELELGVDQQAVKELAGHRGFGLFVGLMMGARQAYYAQLAALQVKDMSTAAHLSVIQGKVQGIDLIRETLLELFIQPPKDIVK